MEAAALANSTKDKGCWRDFKPGNWCDAVDVRDFIVCNVTPYTGDAEIPGGAVEAHQGSLGQASALLPGREEERRACRRCKNAVDDAGAQGRIYRPRQRGGRRIADRRAVQAGDFSVRRLADGRGRPQGGGHRSRSAGASGVYEVPEIPQRRRIRRLHARNHAVSQVRHHHRPSGFLWPRPDYRRLPPRRALWRRAPDRAPSGRNARRSTTCGRPTRSSACARSSRTRCARSKTSPPWRNYTGAISRARRQTRKRRCNGRIWLIWARSRKRTARRCRSAASRASWTFSSSATSRKAHWMKPARRSCGTSWSRSSASCASFARPNTTRCSAAIPTGRPNASAAST